MDYRPVSGNVIASVRDSPGAWQIARSVPKVGRRRNRRERVPERVGMYPERNGSLGRTR